MNIHEHKHIFKNIFKHKSLTITIPQDNYILPPIRTRDIDFEKIHEEFPKNTIRKKELYQYNVLVFKWDQFDIITNDFERSWEELWKDMDYQGLAILIYKFERYIMTNEDTKDRIKEFKNNLKKYKSKLPTYFLNEKNIF